MTTASSHLSKELKQLIKSIGQTKSKQQQDKIIINQLQWLKPNLSQPNIPPKKLKQYLIRALYIEMLGHSAPFAHIHAINLTQNKSLILKRIGYLMCSVFFNKNSDMLIMLVATIMKDLASNDVHEIVICLTALGNIMNNTIASGVVDSIVKLTQHTTDLVRKKALLILQKIKQQTDVQVPDYKDKLKKGLCDRQPSVMAATLNLYYDEIKENPRKYRELTSSFVIILKQVVEHKLPKQFDYHRMPAPWIQIKLMKILQLLGKGDTKASQHCYTILQQALKRADQTNNSISFAITYQCIKTIFTIYPNPKLVQQAASSLTKFLSATSNNNLKHMGLRLLSLAHKDHPKLLDQYQLTIVQCLESKDQTLKQQTLDLLYRMTTNENIEIIVTKMLDTLHGSTDTYFRNTLVLKITQLCERCSPTHKWYLETMQMLFELGSQYLNENVLNNFLKLVVETYEQTGQEFGQEIIEKMKGLIEKVVPTDFIIRVVVWTLGEIGARLYAGDGEKLEELYKIVYKCFDFDIESQETKNWIIDAIVKLSSTNGFKNHSNVKIMLDTYLTSGSILTYQRSLQSKKMAKYNAALKKSNQVNFEEDLAFLDGFVQMSRMNGAKQYRKVRSKQISQSQIRFTPYQTKNPAQSSFPFGTTQSKKQPSPTKQVPVVTKPPVVVIPPSKPQQKPKKQFITPEQKAKMAKAKQIFGGPTTKTSTTLKPKGPQSKKQTKPNSQAKVQTTIDLI